MYPLQPVRGESWFHIRRRSTCDPWGVCLQEGDRNRPCPAHPGSDANLRVGGKSRLMCCFPVPFELRLPQSDECKPLAVRPFSYELERTLHRLPATKRNNST